MKKILLMVLVVLLLCAMTGCNAFKHIEDTNGAEDYSLCSLTEADLVSGSNRVVEYMSSKTTKGNVTKISAKKISGVKTLYSFQASSDKTYSFEINSEIKSGNMKIYVCNNGKIVEDVAIGELEFVPIKNLSGKVQLKIACESAEMSVTFKANL